MTKPKAAIVTGATGYLGSNLVRALLAEGWEVTCIPRDGSRHAAHEWHSRTRGVVYDGSGESLIRAGDFAGRETVVFHLAAAASYHCPPEKIGEMIASNITFGTHLLEAMRHWGVANLVNVGTYWQYDQAMHYKPKCLYAATKQAFEDIIAFYLRRDEVRCSNLVLFDVYGPHDPRRKIIPLLNDHARTGERLALSPGMQKIDMVYIADAVSALQVAACRLLRKDIHVAPLERHAVSSGVRLTLQEIVATYEQVMSAKLNVVWGGISYRDREIMEPWQPAAKDCLESWQPRYSLREGLAAIRETMS